MQDASTKGSTFSVNDSEAVAIDARLIASRTVNADRMGDDVK